MAVCCVQLDVSQFVLLCHLWIMCGSVLCIPRGVSIEPPLLRRPSAGYVWLVRKTFTKNGGLAIVSTTNEDNPLSRGMMPLLVIDLWEHAYYLKHSWKREQYLAEFWSVVEWDNIAELELFWLETLEEEDNWRKRDEL